VSHSANDDIAFSTPDIREPDIDAVSDVLRGGWLTSGAVTVELEAALKAYTGARDVVVVSSCTAALEASLAFLQPRGRRVYVPTWTFASTANVPLRLGADVTLLDVTADTLSLDPQILAAELRKPGPPAVVVPVHFAGAPIDNCIAEICAEHGADMVEDGAHAFGAIRPNGSHIGTGAGTWGAALSFYATKNLTSGEGGALVTDDASLGRFARVYRLHGLSHDAWRRYQPGASPTYDLKMAGAKSNLPDILAALALSQLQRFDQSQERRRQIVDLYCKLLEPLDNVEPLPSMGAAGSAHHLFVAMLAPTVSRDVFLREMSTQGVHCSVHFQPLHTFEFHKDTPMVSGGVADRARMRAVSLPLRPNLDDDGVHRVVEAVHKALRTARHD
jgi:dTDP-4-amino-4,6-dideoxygalactose transaminase